MTQLENKTSRAKRTPPDKRRELIIEEACRQCMTRGRSGFSFVEIARKLKITRSLVYHYFPNQEALMKALAEKRILGFFAKTQDFLHGTTEEQLTNLFTNWSDYLAEAPDYIANLIRSSQGRAVLDAASEDKIPAFLQLMKSCFGRPALLKDDEVFYAMTMYVRTLLARNSQAPRPERLKWVQIAVKTCLAAVAATDEVLNDKGQK